MLLNTNPSKAGIPSRHQVTACIPTGVESISSICSLVTQEAVKHCDKLKQDKQQVFVDTYTRCTPGFVTLLGHFGALHLKTGFSGIL